LTLLAVVLTTAFIITHAQAIAIGWGVIVTFINEVVKQDTLSKSVNTAIASGIAVATAVVLALTHVPAGQSQTWGSLGGYLSFVGLGVLITYYPFLKPLGIADWIQSHTTFYKPSGTSTAVAIGLPNNPLPDPLPDPLPAPAPVEVPTATGTTPVAVSSVPDPLPEGSPAPVASSATQRKTPAKKATPKATGATKTTTAAKKAPAKKAAPKPTDGTDKQAS
jgi:hypothetical protein